MTATPNTAALPIRVQLSRAKGWKMPPNTVKVDRSTVWGNPYRVGEKLLDTTPPISAETAVQLFSAWIEGEASQHGQTVQSFLSTIRGKNLACWCKPGTPCHADVLLKLANEPRALIAPPKITAGMIHHVTISTLSRSK